MALIDELRTRIASQFEERDILFQFKCKVSHHAIKKNNRIIFRNRSTGLPFLGKDGKLTKAENLLTGMMERRAGELGLSQPIESDIWLIAIFYFDNYYTKKGQRNKRLGDLSNLIQLPEDCLTKARVIQDDQQICSYDLSRRLPAKENCLEIFLLKFREKLPIN